MLSTKPYLLQNNIKSFLVEKEDYIIEYNSIKDKFSISRKEHFNNKVVVKDLSLLEVINSIIKG